MALRDQPYIPLYVKDYLTDEKLNNCSAASQGVFIKIMCVLHKQENYGKILLKPKVNLEVNTIPDSCLAFAQQLSKQLSFDTEIILSALEELVSEDVLQLKGDTLSQKRMVKDFSTSLIRYNNGKKGGNPNLFKSEDNSEVNLTLKGMDNYEDNQNPVYANAIVNKNKKGVRKKFVKPTLAEFTAYFIENEFDAELAKRAFTYYDELNWHDNQGNAVVSWKGKCQSVWFKPENKPKTGSGERSAADMEKIYDLYREPGSTSRFVP